MYDLTDKWSVYTSFTARCIKSEAFNHTGPLRPSVSYTEITAKGVQSFVFYDKSTIDKRRVYTKS